jgi:hypothetical protein
MLHELLDAEPVGPRDHEVPEPAIRELMMWYDSLMNTDGEKAA